ncbi:MAG TPA: hypothetical protein VG735_04570 [Caulobacterales bacterium]|nr:hypothetical protein [Caulobacterales bacterium]
MSDTAPSPKNGTPAQAGKVAGSAFLVATFGLLAIVLIGLAGYYAFQEHLPLSSPKIWVALFGAVYVGWRAWTIYSRNKNAR